MELPHYVRVARALALTAGLEGCAQAVGPGVDAATTDVVRDTGNVCSTQCPASPPVNGSPCTNTLSCTYNANGLPTSCNCEHTNDASCAGTWQCFTAVPGPLPPPELPS